MQVSREPSPALSRFREPPQRPFCLMPPIIFSSLRHRPITQRALNVRRGRMSDSILLSSFSTVMIETTDSRTLFFDVDVAAHLVTIALTAKTNLRYKADDVGCLPPSRRGSLRSFFSFLHNVSRSHTAYFHFAIIIMLPDSISRTIGAAPLSFPCAFYVSDNERRNDGSV